MVVTFYLPDAGFMIEMLRDSHFKIKHYVWEALCKDLIDIWRHMVNIIPDTGTLFCTVLFYFDL